MKHLILTVVLTIIPVFGFSGGHRYSLCRFIDLGKL